MKAKAVRKPKAKLAPVKSEEEEKDEINDAEPAADSEENTKTQTTPVKPKRKYTRKPKDPNNPPAKRAKKQASTLAAKGNGDSDEDKEEEGEDANTALFSGSHKAAAAAIKAEENLGSDFDVQTASQEQLAAENVLVPNAV